MRKNVAIFRQLSYNVRRFEGEVPQRERKRSQRYLLHSDPRSGYPSPSRPWSTSDSSPQEDKTLRTWALTRRRCVQFSRLELGVATRKKRAERKRLYEIILWREGLNPFQPSPLLKISTGTGKIILCRKQSLSHLPALSPVQLHLDKETPSGY